MSSNETRLSEQESLEIITDMIQKARASYHETGISALLWGTAVFIAGMVTFLQEQFHFRLPFDIWLIVLFALVPQVIISIKESKQRPFRSHHTMAIDIVWIVYALTIFGLVAYQLIVPVASQQLLAEDGWQLIRHTIRGEVADEIIYPFPPSFTSVFLLVYAFPTLFTGMLTRFRPMIAGAIITYAFFIVSLYTPFKYDMLLAAATALVCWFIPGVILRKRYLKQVAANV